MLNKFYLNLNKNYLFKNFLQSTFLTLRILKFLIVFKIFSSILKK